MFFSFGVFILFLALSIERILEYRSFSFSEIVAWTGIVFITISLIHYGIHFMY